MFGRICLCMKLILQLLIDWVPVFFQMIYGLIKLSRVPRPYVTFFGGARFAQHEQYTQMAQDLAEKLAGHDISILTGGGPGIMQAANCGVSNLLPGVSKARTMGITVSELNEGGVNACAQEQIALKYFFARKWLLTKYSEAFVVFPGGFGTLDELMELLTLIKTKQLPVCPVILVGAAYWQKLMDWLLQVALKNQTITQSELDLIIVTDNLVAVVDRIVANCKQK